MSIPLFFSPRSTSSPVFHQRPPLLLLVVLAAFGAASPALRAEVKLAPLFCDNAVLQRGKPVPVWGTAGAGEKVEVRFGDDKKVAVADEGGRWKVELDPMEACADPKPLVVSGQNQVTCADVLVGEVWLCSGQSNMVVPVAASLDPEAEIAAANYPALRYFGVAKTVAETPQESVPGKWESCTPRSAGRFAAAAYYFGREIHRELGVPVGLIVSSVGATPIEAWMSADSLAGTPFAGNVASRWKTQLAEYPSKLAEHEVALAKWRENNKNPGEGVRPKKNRPPVAPSGPGGNDTPSGLYNGMIHPLIPYALRGITWYQGESNVDRPEEYRVLFPVLIARWREAFQQGNLPFYFVQLANFIRKGDTSEMMWAFLRDAQAAVLALPATGMATAIDIGDPDDIHPKNKQEVGRRLALLAFARTYGKSIESSGPVLKEAVREGSRIRMRFDHAGGLVLRDATPGAFEVSSDGGQFSPATAEVVGDEVWVSSPGVSTPVEVRYAWRNNPSAPLANGAGLPAPPFRATVR